MKSKLFSLTLGTILVLGASLDAQDTKRWSFSASAGLSADGLDAVTNSGTEWWNFGAFNFDFGYTGKIAGSDVPFRASIGINHCPMGSNTRNHRVVNPETGQHIPLYPKRGLLGYQLAGDMFFDSIIVDGLQFLVGGSLNHWSMTEKQADGSTETHNISGVKFGGRIGLEYTINEKFAFQAIFQLIELGTNRSHIDDPTAPGYTRTTGNRTWNPSWLQFGVKYSF